MEPRKPNWGARLIVLASLVAVDAVLVALVVRLGLIEQIVVPRLLGPIVDWLFW